MEAGVDLSPAFGVGVRERTQATQAPALLGDGRVDPAGEREVVAHVPAVAVDALHEVVARVAVHLLHRDDAAAVDRRRKLTELSDGSSAAIFRRQSLLLGRCVRSVKRGHQREEGNDDAGVVVYTHFTLQRSWPPLAELT